MIGSLLYLTASRPDIMVSVGMSARYQADPKESHLKAVKRIIKYVKGFSDADWAGNADDRKSTSGGCFFIWKNLVAWLSKKQNSISLSTAEAKYIAADSPFSPEVTNRILATIKEHSCWLDDLSDKEQRQLLALAHHVSAAPFPIPTEVTPAPAVPEPLPATVPLSPTDPVVSPLSLSPLEHTLSTSRKIDFNVSLPEQFVSTSSINVRSLPLPNDPYDPASHPLSGYPTPLISFSDYVSSLSSNFSIRNIAQNLSSPAMPMTCSAFSIPIHIPASVTKSENAPLSVSPTKESIPLITVPLSKSSRKGKEKLSDAGHTEKRKISAVVDVDGQTDRKHQRRGSTLPPRITRSRAHVDTPVVPLPSGSKSRGSGKIYKPKLLSPNLFAVWQTHVHRDFIIEKTINEGDLVAKCNIIPLLRDQSLLASLRHVGPYSTWLTAEFYTNLTLDTFTEGSARFHQVFIRGTWYPFGPTEFNAYLGTPNHHASPDPSPQLLAAALTHNKNVSWPSDELSSLKLTTVYSVFLRLASANWVPAVRRHQVSEHLAGLLYKIRNCLPFNLGMVIFSHLMSFLQKKETKVHLPFPCLIYGVLQDHGFKPYKEEVITTPDNAYIFDDRLAQRGHYDDQASLAQLPDIPHPAPLVSAPASSADTASASRPGVRQVPKEPTTLVDRRQIVLTLEASIAQVQQSVASQQATISGLENLRDAQLKEIARMEAIHAQILAHTGVAPSDSDSEDEENDSDSGTPSAR
ncbi:PREDICTED: uncharacterized protein LOC109167401 [Ipomoea nil]|uniref:uncharacterized protein LOC109167401 n=1 Tax=Ipomoea nil TaxID=35883 RepID=UPI0009009AA3|nr:PREDICTED: uncharacterized protein LOC109167401 [Ipomoea nil]